MTIKDKVLIYGSYGYTGTLITNLCLQQGLKPILGGRSNDQLILQAKQTALEFRVFDLNDSKQTEQVLQECIAVINCAGPFWHTYKPMVQACIATKTHYVDITGEFMVIEQLTTYNEQAKASGIMILPGAGFDVVPSDCLAQYLKFLLPDAQELTIAITSENKQQGAGLGVSRGTAKTMLDGISIGTMIRDQGVLKKFLQPGKQKPLILLLINPNTVR